MAKKRSDQNMNYDAPQVSLSDFDLTAHQHAILSHWWHNRATPAAETYATALRAELPKELVNYILGDGESCGERLWQDDFFKSYTGEPFPTPANPTFEFIDLFAGIGGFRMAMQASGGRCVFSSEWDPAAQKTYQANYGEVPYGDITSPSTKASIPSGFDVLCAGFPCQAFSIAGKRQGFDDSYRGMSRGTLFRDVVEICEKHHPKAIFCENVKGLLSHNRGKTFEVIKGAFQELGYTVFTQILNSKDFGVPQNRERIYIVCFRNDLSVTQFTFPQATDSTKCLRDIIEQDPVPAKYYLSDVYVDTLKRHKARHTAKGNGFGYEIREWDSIAGAIVCGGMGRERNLIVDDRQKNLVPTTHIKGTINTEGIRKMTPREWARLQGYPDTFKFVLADVHLYKQFGNSVSVPVITAISQQIIQTLNHCAQAQPKEAAGC